MLFLELVKGMGDSLFHHMGVTSEGKLKDTHDLYMHFVRNLAQGLVLEAPYFCNTFDYYFFIIISNILGGWPFSSTDFQGALHNINYK